MSRRWSKRRRWKPPHWRSLNEGPPTIERTYDASRRDSRAAYAYVGEWQVSTQGVLSTTPTGRGIVPGLTVVIEKSCDFDKWQQKVDSLAALADGWNGYDAPAPSELARETAKRFLSQLGQRGTGAGGALRGGGRRRHAPGRSPPRLRGVLQRRGGFALFSDDDSPPVSKIVPPDFMGFRDLIDEIRNYLNA